MVWNLFIVIILLQYSCVAYTLKGGVNDEEVGICKSFNDKILKAENVIPGLEYLGNGYNIYKSLPFGTDNIPLDPGYMQPVVQFRWACDVGDDLIMQNKPIGVWARNESACHRSHQSRRIDNDESVVKLISEDMTTSFSFSDEIGINNTTEYTNLKEWFKQHSMNMIIYKSDCAIYTAGMILSHEWNVTNGFNIILNELTKLITDGKECDLKVYRDQDPKSPCFKIVQKWFDIFNTFGTHVLTRITFGGKIMHMLYLDKVTTNNNSNVDKKTTVDVNLNLLNSNVEVKAKDKKKNRNKTANRQDKIYVIGGDTLASNMNDKEFRRWIKTVSPRPMPIKLETTPLASFIPNDLIFSYWHCLEVYKRTNFNNVP